MSLPPLFWKGLVPNALSTSHYYYCFLSVPGPQVATDMYLDTLGGQENTQDSSKGNSSTGSYLA